MGEIGLDGWIKNPDPAQQQEVFVWQLRLAAERNLPASIHCLQAWGKLLQILQRESRPECGFLLHSFGGPSKMIQPLVKLGAYFSLPPAFAREGKARQRENFRCIPIDRLLIETDAPDQIGPEDCIQFPLTDSSGKPINHPANLVAVYRFAARLLDLPIEKLATQVEQNFKALFGRVRTEI
jgi:TatD DNase family protein